MVGWMQQKILEALSQYDPLEVIVGTPIVILLLYICVFRPLEVILDDYYDAKNKDLFEVSEKFKLIEPPLYYCKMPNSERMIGLLGQDKKLVFEPLKTFQSWYLNATCLFSRDEIESLDILAPYRDFEWSEYRESMDS